MYITELTELQFKNYSNLHSKKNFKQSVEYANLKETKDYKKLYLALVDENRVLNARLNALSEVVAEQSQVMEKILRTCSEIPVTNNRPDAVLFW